MVKILLFGLFFIIASPLFLSAQNRLPAFEMNERLGRGINIGNTFEAPSDTEWGNPWQPEYFQIISELGFQHVRLPVRWEPAERSMADAPYTINSTFLERIQEVVDAALENDLYIIVNMHHHEALYEDPAGQKERFLSQWYQIADYFKDYPDLLLFEVMNEPHGNLTPDLWNEFFANALVEIRKTNPTRMVIMGVAEYGGLGGIPNLQLPDDEYIILSPHYYNPFNFTHQGAEWVGPQADAWLGTEWNDTEADRETVASEFSYALEFSETHHIPIHVGEFGAYSTADIASRERWTTFLARWFEQQNMSWAYWEFNSGFGIYDPATGEYITPLVDALLHNEMPEPRPVTAIPMYTSDFSNGTDGWSLGTQGGASGSLAAVDGNLDVSIANGGTEGWHVQLVRGNIPLEEGKMYRISFKASATADRSGSFYAGKDSDPWNAYSGYNGISISTVEKEFSFSFTMTNPTDLASRLVFDLGTNVTGVTITEIKVEELEFVITALDEEVSDPRLVAYPNPVTSFLYSNELRRYRRVEVFDLHGRLWASFDLTPHTTSIDLGGATQGLYVLRLTGNGMSDHIKIVKQ